MQEDGYIETYTIKSVDEMLNIFSINGKYSNVNSNYVFRGIKNIKYPLIPSALRSDNIEYISKICSLEDFQIRKDLEIWQVSVEYDIIRQFYNIADKSGLSIPEISRLRIGLDDGDYYPQGLVF
jgi:hypothetical protein